MDRSIGEIFRFRGHKIRVDVAEKVCWGCFFNLECSKKDENFWGSCLRTLRNDHTSVIFVDMDNILNENGKWVKSDNKFKKI